MPSSSDNYYYLVKSFMRRWTRGGRGGNPGIGASGIDGISLPVPNNLGQPSQANNQEGLPDGAAIWIDWRVVQCSKCDPSHVAYYGTEANTNDRPNARRSSKRTFRSTAFLRKNRRDDCRLFFFQTFFDEDDKIAVVEISHVLP